MPAKSVPSTGTANIPVILINFNDRSTTYTPANFNILLFGNGTKSMKDYYEEVSYGKFSCIFRSGGIAGWYTASQNHDYYGINNNGNIHVPRACREAVEKADQSFDFSPYDRQWGRLCGCGNIVHQGPGEEDLVIRLISVPIS